MPRLGNIDLLKRFAAKKSKKSRKHQVKKTRRAVEFGGSHATGAQPDFVARPVAHPSANTPEERAAALEKRYIFGRGA